MTQTRPDLRAKALPLVGVVVLMVGLSFASVPLYRIFCQVTGFAGTTQVAAKGSDVVLDRTIQVRFNASTDNAMPWTFQPLVQTVDLKIGETGLAFYEAHNPTGRTITGTAVYNVTPDSVGAYFTKIDCFCFTEQTLAPGQRVQMPVTYFVDPSIVNDPEARGVHTITLSYTFFEAERQTALDSNSATTQR